MKLALERHPIDMHVPSTLDDRASATLAATRNFTTDALRLLLRTKNLLLLGGASHSVSGGSRGIRSRVRSPSIARQRRSGTSYARSSRSFGGGSLGYGVTARKST